MTTEPIDKRWLTTAEAARRLGRTRQYVSAICRTDPGFGWRPHDRAHWRVDADVVEAVLAGRRRLKTPWTGPDQPTTG